MTSLAGLKVIDLSRVLGGPYCTQLLADHGATVIKVEPPQGDETRAWGPPFEDDTASYFIGVNRNKLGMALDLSMPEAREVLLDLLADADILVENFKPGTLEKWGLGYDMLATRFERLIHCRVSGFGGTGPLGGLPGYDAVVQAMCGLMSVNGEVGAQSLRVGVPVIDIVTGMNAVIAILLALNERVHSGRGQLVEATLYDSGVSLMHPHLPNYYLSGRASGRTGNAHPNICPYDLFPTATSPVFLAVGNDAQFARFADTIDAGWLATDIRFLTNASRLKHRDALRAEIIRLLAERDGEHLAQVLMQRGVPCGPVLDTASVAAHPHTKHRQMTVRIGHYTGTATPVKLTRTEATYRSAPPAFAEHAREILEGLGYGESKIAWLLDSGAVPVDLQER
ncbi:CoA transferase [Burkholderia pseudomallei]|uniref:CaiB/BaiF CoA transferase family protein n=1 Tax=Burkholderia pseudomallei TaxID=28450 RepID=UPI0003D942AA|nr:CoA transferase [Burkholderia pseudomallei]AHE35432.1 coA-transferase III family protein [Burkholderia pseudomallei NAU20B-16]AHG37747.1 coA-transferase III family protein [Burkholderia pseudomallei MSHR511]AHG70146.1 coA-transferase III family protein [Burkholderia pseudomallei MSHR146]AIV74471.1 coA-transferase III family protein [Burkholderia pseudomallei]AYE30974.1 CoA transferase [Burkholderia pseudomallei]